ncbi:MAG: DUF1289 domain-containing protein [Gammaproteobacteria bacterium]|nr:DUF1289 domain-containing protein [Gammaproteobacteria bacterium]
MASAPTDRTTADEAQPVRSPCIKVCVLNAAEVCVGCGRHIEEIAGWSQRTAEQQRSICEQAAVRLRLMASAD